MSVFSRGLITLPRCAPKVSSPAIGIAAQVFRSRFVGLRALSPAATFLQPQFFSTATALHAAKKQRSPTPARSPAIRTSQPAVSDYVSYAASFEKKGHSTILYEAPSHTGYILSSYIGATFCFLYAAINISSNFFFIPSGVQLWVPYAYAVISIMMACLGTFLMLSPARIIKSITAVPSSILRTQAHAGKTSKSLPKQRHQGLAMEVELRKIVPIPFLRTRKLVVAPREVELARPLTAVAQSRLSPLQDMVKQREKKEKHQEWLTYVRAHPFTFPFRDIKNGLRSTGNGIQGAFFNIRRSWTREGFMKVYVKGQRYKLDTTSAWVLENGRPLDRLAKIKNTN